MKNCFRQMRDVIDVQTSTILDVLVSHDVLSESDEDSVRGKRNRKSQNEELIGCLVGRLTLEEFHKVLLPALEEQYPSVAESLIAEVDRLERDYEEKLCIACRVRRDVQVKRIATALLTNKHISYAMYSDLRSAGMSNSAKWAELRSVPDKNIISALGTSYPDFYRDLNALDLPSLDCRCIEGKGEEGPDEETATSDSDMKLIELDEEVNRIEVFSTAYETTDTAYKMTARPRGICLIINNTEVKGRLNRSWSNVDQEKLQRVFTKLEFQVITRTNLTAEQMSENLEEMTEVDHSKFDAFVCCILTYGNKDGLFGHDGKIISDTQLTDPFKASWCPSLAGKPKLFFIQANRTEIKYSRPAEGPTADDADFLLGYCTSPNSGSFVNEMQGSFYITALTEILDAHSDRHDILTCMRMVNQKVAGSKYFRSGQWYEQVPAPVFTLTKDVFLTSSPCWPHMPTE